MARAKALTDLGDTDVLDRLTDAREELFNLRFQIATSQLDDTSALKKAKKNIARLLTEVRAREVAAATRMERESAESGENGD